MPQIKEYTSRSDVAGAAPAQRMSGEELGAPGRALSQFGQTLEGVGDVVYKRQEQKETADANAQLSQAHADITKALAQQTQQGTVNTEEFMQNVDDRLQQAGQGLSTNAARDYYQRNSQALKQHFLQSALASQSDIAGAKAKVDYQNSLNNYSSGLIGDPSSYPVVKQAHDDYLDQLVKNGSLPYDSAIKLKVLGDTELSKSAVRGWIQVNPDDAKQRIQSGEFDATFDGDVKKQLLGEADTASRAKEIESERIQKAQEKALQQKQQLTQNDFLSKMVDGSLSTKDILDSNLSAFGSGSKEQFLNLLKQETQKRSETDPATFNDLFQRIHLPDNDPKKILDENDLNQYVGRGLGLTDLNRLRNEIQGDNTQAGKNISELKKSLLDQAQQKLVKKNPMLGIADPEGEKNYASWLVQFQDQWDKKIKQGIPPRELLNPDSKDYLGNTTGFVKSPTQIMQNLIQQQTAPAAPAPTGPKARLPGETIDAWRKRTKDN